MRGIWVCAAALLLTGALPALAEDFIETDGPLDDETFYRLVSCGAPPGGACTKPVLRWPTDRPLDVSLTRIDRAFLGGKQARAKASVTRALQYINEADIGLRLRPVPPGAEADIEIYFLDVSGTEVIEGSGIAGLDGTTLPGARVQVWGNIKSGTITRARIVFGTNLPRRQYESAMIEEMTQALGLLTDIRNPTYDGVSVFSQDSNEAKVLGPQDIMALRRHYKKQE